MTLIRPIIKALIGLSLLTGCAGEKLLDLAIPERGYTLHKDIAYGIYGRNKLDVYVPENPAASRDVILFFYGGSWQKGSKDIYRFFGQKFAERGYVTVIADYRLYPDVYFPAFVEDGAQAVKWVHKHIHDYGGNPDNLFLAGHSAGGYIAVMLTLNERFLKAEGGSRAWIRGTVGIAGPYDFLPFTDPEIKSIFSQESDESTQPINYVEKGVPPMLLLTGDEDEDVGMKNTMHLAARLREYGNPVTEKIYPGIAHIGIILAVANGFESKAPVVDDMVNFINTYHRP